MSKIAALTNKVQSVSRGLASLMSRVDKAIGRFDLRFRAVGDVLAVHADDLAAIKRDLRQLRDRELPTTTTKPAPDPLKGLTAMEAQAVRAELDSARPSLALVKLLADFGVKCVGMSRMGLQLEGVWDMAREDAAAFEAEPWQAPETAPWYAAMKERLDA